ncbi:MULTISPECIES: Rho-binding antiterminator [Vibrio]|uniref:Transcriptional regulator n=1 Tax=Vibrio diazotrophicus TaxID=685 RepID=A0A2J8HYS0_VIBDI|nr:MULTISPECIES: Rho-binding antiterminator [Vibrio]MCF7363644.1 Rho-binding antiterminator [Vibrio sp. A1-b2]PNH91739.1 transcriptional regulator [Vibrio diazotrophicus]PNI03409.1 transcriptional regulator [Vibrio diazotrophicus]
MISCGNYDYIEIVCLFKYSIEITLKSGEVVSGKALDTAKNSLGEECIKLLTQDSDLLVVLDSIAKMKVTMENPHFQEVAFD